MIVTIDWVTSLYFAISLLFLFIGLLSSYVSLFCIDNSFLSFFLCFLCFFIFIIHHTIHSIAYLACLHIQNVSIYFSSLSNMNIWSYSLFYFIFLYASTFVVVSYVLNLLSVTIQMNWMNVSCVLKNNMIIM